MMQGVSPLALGIENAGRNKRQHRTVRINHLGQVQSAHGAPHGGHMAMPHAVTEAVGPLESLCWGYAAAQQDVEALDGSERQRGDIEENLLDDHGRVSRVG